MTDAELQALQAWVGREVHTREWLHPAPPRQLAATFDLAQDAQSLSADTPVELPPMWQLLYGLQTLPSAGLGVDGAERSSRDTGSAAWTGGLPPVPMAEVMWAGADHRIDRPLRMQAEANCVLRVARIERVQGRRGPLVFASTSKSWFQEGRHAVTETTHAVFMDAAPPLRTGDPEAVLPTAREMVWPLDEVRLFRFSALTFNAHRIHYDPTYARDQAGYPGLVVHGPLQALLIAETSRRWYPGRTLRAASFKARVPVFLDGPIRVCATPPQASRQLFWTTTREGLPAIEATLEFTA